MKKEAKPKRKRETNRKTSEKKVKTSNTNNGGETTNEKLYTIFESKLNKGNDHFDFEMARDEERRPIWLTKDNHIFVETFCPTYNNSVYEFIIAISEPLSRPNFIHEFKITKHSIFAAVSQGLDKEMILSGLNKYSKVKIPETVINFISMCAKGFGKKNS